MLPRIPSPPRRVVAAAFLLLLPAVVPADGKPLDSLRADGIIAERYDGYLEIRVEDPPARAESVVERVNRERRRIYERRAEEQDVPRSEVGKVYAQKILKKAPDGTYFLAPDGSYTRK